MFAAVGNDGFRSVVWGVGETMEAAVADAREWLGEAEVEHESGELDVHEITAEQAAVVRNGDVSWPILHGAEGG